MDKGARLDLPDGSSWIVEQSTPQRVLLRAARASDEPSSQALRATLVSGAVRAAELDALVRDRAPVLTAPSKVPEVIAAQRARYASEEDYVEQCVKPLAEQFKEIIRLHLDHGAPGHYGVLGLMIQPK